uniref:Lipase maturation factor n=2 Tax=Cacopsylla melanoneura TaxID=428564 RepID=A0A8D8RR14_9HEMI
MAQIRYTRNLFLRTVCLVYVFAFASLYIQIPGLYGDNGILPARSQLEGDESLPLQKKLHRKPTLLWLAPFISLSTEYMMDVISLVGIFLGFTGFVSQKFCCKPNFFALWSLYYSLFQVGQTFMTFQWDSLLLETGFLCILVAPFGINKDSYRKGSSPSDQVKFWLVSWLLFRLILTSPINKLSSGDPSWWTLKALGIHFQSMALPTPLAWFCHHIPAWGLRLTTAFSLAVELILPPLFLLPLSGAKKIAFYFQMFLQFTIIITGNFNWYNLLTIALCFSLLDDSYFYPELNRKKNKLLSILSWVVSLVVFGAACFVFYKLFGLKIDQKPFTVQTQITFSKIQYDDFLGQGLVIAIFLGVVSFLWTALAALWQTFRAPSKNGTLSSLVVTFFYIATALMVFSINTVPLANLHPFANKTSHPLLKSWHSQLAHLHISNSYGLFRVMTGVDGRPEVIIEGANNRQGPWTEIPFRYKPGNVNRTLPIVAPHQPRLDWQMWFAALGTYHQNPWISSLAYRLLTHQPEVLALLDVANYPFKSKAPAFVRAVSYKYYYSPAATKTPQWWIRNRQEEYFPEFEANHQPLIAYLTQFGILKKRKPEYVEPRVKNALDALRKYSSTLEPAHLLWSLFITGLAIIYLRGGSKQAAPSANNNQGTQGKKQQQQQGQGLSKNKSRKK